MNDLKKFKHGEEQTHFACAEMSKKYGMKVRCCGCNGHKCESVQESQSTVSSETVTDKSSVKECKCDCDICVAVRETGQECAHAV